MEQGSKKQFLYILFGVGLISLLSFALSWVWGHSYIEVSAQNTGSENQYSIINSAGKLYAETTHGQSYKKLVKKGSYQVVVRSGEKNYYAFVETKGLLKKTLVNARLTTENERMFVGNNPSPCMYYFGDAMFSNECDQSVRQLAKHLPASGYTPSYTQTSSSTPLFGLLGSITVVKNGTAVALLKDVEGIAGYYMQVIDANMNGGERVRLNGPNPNHSYAVLPYKEGVLMYNLSGLEAYYVQPGNNMSSTKVSLGAPKNSTLAFQKISVREDAIISLYTNNTNLDAINSQDEEASIPEDTPGTSEVVVSKDGAEKHYVLPYAYSSATLCSDTKLCAIGLGGASVYDISEQQKPRLLYTIPLVSDVLDVSREKTRFITSLGILSYSPASSDGHLEYSFGKYQYCGSQNAGGYGVLLCLIDSKQNKVGLLVENTPVSGGAIDKQVLSLLSLKDISMVSVYKNNVLVIPAFPEHYSSRDALRTSKAIEGAIRKSGIDTSVYTVLNVASLQ